MAIGVLGVDSNFVIARNPGYWKESLQNKNQRDGTTIGLKCSIKVVPKNSKQTIYFAWLGPLPDKFANKAIFTKSTQDPLPN